MDPVHVIAAHKVSNNGASTQKDIDAFYDENAFERFHIMRRRWARFYAMIIAGMKQFKGAQLSGTKIARTAQHG